MPIDTLSLKNAAEQLIGANALEWRNPNGYQTHLHRVRPGAPPSPVRINLEKIFGNSMLDLITTSHGLAKRALATQLDELVRRASRNAWQGYMGLPGVGEEVVGTLQGQQAFSFTWDPYWACVAGCARRGNRTSLTYLKHKPMFTPGTPATAVIVDDSLQSGLKAFTAIDLLRKNGVEPVAVFVLVDYGQGGAEKLTAKTGVPVHSLFTVAELVDVCCDMLEMLGSEAQLIKQYLQDNRF